MPKKAPKIEQNDFLNLKAFRAPVLQVIIGISSGLLVVSAPVFSSTYSWVGTGSNDLNRTQNWSPIGTPGATDIAVFNSSASRINLSPTATSEFDIGAFNFSNSAQAFSFSIDNATFSMNSTGACITGNQTNTTVNATNTDNSTPLPSPQIALLNTNSSGSAIFNAVNTGHLSGNAGSSTVSEIGGTGYQIVANSSFSILNQGQFNASNTGVCNTTGEGGNTVGSMGNSQIVFQALLAHDNVYLTASTDGTNSGSDSSNSVGYVGNPQINIFGNFTAGNNLTLTTTNMGTDTSSGSGSNQVGFIYDNQIELDSATTIGNNAVITSTNTAINSNNGTGNSIGHVDGAQFNVRSTFSSGDFLKLNANNIGTDTSSSGSTNGVGTAGYNQIEFDSTCTIGNNATIKASNRGTSSSNGSNNSIGWVYSDQLIVSGNFTAGNDLTLSASNSGTMTGSTGANNLIGYIQNNQMEFDGSCTVGNNATMSLSNSGEGLVAGNSVGYISGTQFYVAGTFSAGTNLKLTTINTSPNTTEVAGVGQVTNSQILFNGPCILSDGTVISATNSGSGIISIGPQILFLEGFTLTSGTATLQAINEGTLGGFGIAVQAGSGGDVNVVLKGNQLNVASNESTFTIGQLNGDANSSVQSNPILVINTDAGVKGVFAGEIQNFGQGASSLVKTGPGTQTLSGTNTFTGQSTLEQGTLVLTGSLASPLTINSGLLKGTGSVAGAVVNSGTISPGQSIGTINFLSGFTNNNGNYDVEVNGAGQSDLINVTGTAAINGGIVTVGSDDGTYKFQNRYTIVDATQVTGGYSSVSALSALIQPTLSYDASHVYLTLVTDIANGAVTPLELAVANALDSIIDPTPAENILLSAIVSASDVPAALDSLTGYQYTNDLLTMELSSRQFIRRLYDPLRSIVTHEPNCCFDPCDCCSRGLEVWFEAGGVFAKLDDSMSAHGFTLDGYEITAGVQKTFNRDWTFGIAASYENDKFHYRHDGGKGTNRTWLGGLYGLYRPSGYYALADLTYGNTSSTIHRKSDIGTATFSATGKPDMNQFTFYGEFGVDFTLCNFLLQPFAGIEAGWYRRDRITESSLDGIGLTFDKKDRSLATSRLGLHLTAWQIENIFDVSFDVAWDARLTNSRNTIHGQFLDFGSEFDVEGTKIGRNSVDYALTVTTHYRDWEIYLEGAGENWNKAQVYTVTGGLKFTW